MVEHVPSGLITLVCAWLYLVIARYEAITILFKSPAQRATNEQKMVERGLLRSFVLEFFLFVPASVVLILLIVRPLIMRAGWVGSLTSSEEGRVGFSAVLGIISYGFPFAAVRRMITRLALKSLQEFTTLFKPPDDR